MSSKKPESPTRTATKKLRRARLDYADAGREWSHFQEAQPIHFEPRMLPDRVGWEWVARDVPDEVPDEVMRYIDATVAATRSALDNLTYGLGIAASMTHKQARGIGFPIVDHPNDWDPTKLAGLKQIHLDRIYEVQPFQSNLSSVSLHPLSQLRTLANRDKHHDGLQIVPSFSGLNGTFPVASDIAGDYGTPEEAQAFVDSLTQKDLDDAVQAHLGPIEEGDIVISFRLPGGVKLKNDVKPAFELPPGAAIVMSGTDLAPVHVVLEHAITYVGHVIEFVSGRIPQMPTLNERRPSQE